MKLFEKQLEELKDRLSATSNHFIFVTIFSYGLAIIITGHLLNKLNPRFGSRTDLVQVVGEPETRSLLRIDIVMSHENVVFTINNNKQITLNEQVFEKQAAPELANTIKDEIANIDRSIGIQGNYDKDETQAVLSFDQNINVFHLKPVLQALADNGISKYAFETGIETKSLNQEKGI